MSVNLYGWLMLDMLDRHSKAYQYRNCLKCAQCAPSTLNRPIEHSRSPYEQLVDLPVGFEWQWQCTSYQFVQPLEQHARKVGETRSPPSVFTSLLPLSRSQPKTPDASTSIFVVVNTFPNSSTATTQRLLRVLPNRSLRTKMDIVHMTLRECINFLT